MLSMSMQEGVTFLDVLAPEIKDSFVHTHSRLCVCVCV